MLSEDIQSLLLVIGEVCRQRRINGGVTQAEQAEKAEISLKAAQAIESGQSGQTAVLMKYLKSLGLLEGLIEAFPDPFAVSPLEELAMKEKAKRARPKRVSRSGKTESDKGRPAWGDER